MRPTGRERQVGVRRDLVERWMGRRRCGGGRGPCPGLAPALALLALLFPAAPGWADTIHLRNGNRIEGRVLYRTEAQVVLEIGRWGRCTFPVEVVERVVLDDADGSVYELAMEGGVSGEGFAGEPAGAAPVVEAAEGGADTSAGAVAGEGGEGEAGDESGEDETPAISDQRRQELMALAYDLTRQKSQPRVRAQNALREAGTEAGPYLVPLLGHADARTRQLATSLLGEVAYRPAVGDLIPLLRDPDMEVRRATDVALQRITGASIAFRAAAPIWERAQEPAAWEAWWAAEQARADEGE